MSVDPRRDVAEAAISDPVQRLEAKVAALDRKIESLRNQPVQVGSGPPAADAATLAEGTPYLDRTNLRRYYVVAGAWRYTALT